MPSDTNQSPNNPPPLHVQHTLEAPLPHRVVPSLGFWQSATGSLHESRLSISGLIPPRPPKPPCPPYPGLPPSPPPPSRSKGRSESVELEEPPPNPPPSSNRVVGSIPPPKPPNGDDGR